MKRVTAQIEVIDTDVDIEVEDDASEADILEALDNIAHENVRVVNWNIEDAGSE